MILIWLSYIEKTLETSIYHQYKFLLACYHTVYWREREGGHIQMGLSINISTMQLSFWLQKLHNCSKIECIEREEGISNLKWDIHYKEYNIFL